jgi:hypothetical protein
MDDNGWNDFAKQAMERDRMLREQIQRDALNTYKQALDRIHLLLTNLEGRDYTPEERKIFDLAEDALMFPG